MYKITLIVDRNGQVIDSTTELLQTPPLKVPTPPPMAMISKTLPKSLSKTSISPRSIDIDDTASWRKQQRQPTTSRHSGSVSAATRHHVWDSLIEGEAPAPRRASSPPPAKHQHRTVAAPAYGTVRIKSKQSSVNE